MRKRTFLGVLAASALLLAGQGPAAAAPVGRILNEGAPDTIPGRYIVGLYGGTSLTASAESLVAGEARTLTGRYGGKIGYVYSASLRGFSAAMSEQQAKRLAADPKVEFVQQSLWVRRATVPTANIYGASRPAANIYGAVRGATRQLPAGEQPNPPSWGLDRIDGVKDRTYKYPNTGTGVTVYNTDSELNTDHAAFEGRARSGYDFVDEDAEVNECKNQFDQGHGTHTAGTSSSEAYGVAKDVTVVGVKVLGCDGNAPDADSIQGVEWVTRNAVKPAVANASWTSGGAYADPEGVNRAVKASIASGITWVVAAGNDNGGNACTPSPAKVPEAITVASTDENDNRSSFSNLGSCVDLFAPGGNITSASNSSNTGSKGMSGTSMAAPHVTGASALYLAANPSATPQQVRDGLVSQALSGVVKNPGTGSPNKLLDVSKIGGSGPPPAGVPVAAFTSNCTDSTLECSFDGSGSKDEGGSIATYRWDFGDGTTGDGVKPAAHKYAKAGSYSVKLTVTDNEGKTDDEVRAVQVGQSAGSPPVAAFSVSCFYQKCDFDAATSRDPDNDIAGYAWKFGDNQTGTGAKLSHNYPAAQATYTAQLTVTDRAGNSAAVTRKIQCYSVGAQALCFAS
ncbi:S8 family serine peptidase [Kribbella sp. CA-293567]|uniref:S8 family serine peptidase n=1 Tax=Kribbella sp. CA-293567 TaxID=3002436 RepID=UPI0022DD00EA|nr:S8 family serine peptidase [Kribbella sp. CA-293567]WBQ07466.1 S8 family serine peptidase [Kribbella sp. CA-293567]